jgi:cytochrome c oxidase subunit 2
MTKAISIGSAVLLGLFFVVLFYLTGTFTDNPDAIRSFINAPATDIAEQVRQNFWFTCLHMLPYFILSEALLIFAIYKFRAGEGRVAAKFHENLKLEIFWTIIPCISVVLIAWPTYDLLEYINTPPRSDLEIKVTGQRFFFKYKYLDYDITIADEALVVPAGKNVTMSLTSVDVLHAWWVPAFGVKYDLVPGRTTQIWFNAETGKYKGQCAELCGESHADMMIDVTVLPEAEFESWIMKRVEAKKAALTASLN